VDYSAPAPRAPRRIRVRWTRVGLLVAIAAVAVALGYQSRPSSSTFREPSAVRTPSTALPPAAPRRTRALPSPARGTLGEAGGAVPGGTTVFDDEVPGVARLDRALRAALRQAATDARGEGVDFIVNSGWRSPAYEDQLRREAVAKYGSEAEAARWVATGATSPHVSGDAVDLAPAGAAWLSAHGGRYGLCQIYRNEPWHYELRPEAIEHGCPAIYADPTQDPRMHE
jgi:D-alanyl-D-alanine carboxypeptidase